jgi:hypothetical protein
MNTEEFLELLASLKSVTREEAAKDQLEGAIWLWFHEDDETSISVPVSVHTLAVAAQGVLASIAREKKVEPSSFFNVLEQQSKAAQEHLRMPQNYFKHGHFKGRGKRDSIYHTSELTEVILADSIGMFSRIFKTSTPLLDTFLVRFSWSFPKSKIVLNALESELSKRIKIEEASRLNRIQFLKTVLPMIVEITAADRRTFAEKRLHSRSPPGPR